MSPRAAWRLVALGFEHVFDYAAGKADWGAAGLALEGAAAALPRAVDAARADVPTCGLDDDLVRVRALVAATAWDTCVVVNERQVVLGRLGRRALSSDRTATVEEAMSEGPGTVRPNVALAPLVARLRERNLTTAVVTHSDGTLVGVIRLSEAESLLREDGD
jgi:CBS-domain-containing membrane protein